MQDRHVKIPKLTVGFCWLTDLKANSDGIYGNPHKLAVRRRLRNVISGQFLTSVVNYGHVPKMTSKEACIYENAGFFLSSNSSSSSVIKVLKSVLNL